MNFTSIWEFLLKALSLLKIELNAKSLITTSPASNSGQAKTGKSAASAKPKKEKEDELEDNWETDVLSWLTKDRIVEIMTEYPQMVSDRYKNEWYMKSVNTNDARWIDNKRIDGIIQFMRINSQYDMRINLHICPNGQPTRVLCVPVFKNGATKRTEFGITEEYFRILIGSFIAQDKNITVKKKIRKINKEFKE